MGLTRLLTAGLCTFAIACGGGSPDSTSCQHDFDCPSGQGCVANTCSLLPCGGCQPDQACSTAGTCIVAQGASCASSTCPSAYPCNAKSNTCAKGCTVNAECDPGTVCNSGLAACAECTFDTDCASRAGRPRCDADHGACVQCNTDFDCVHSLGIGHYCSAHVCAPGCATDDDCNPSNAETCDTTQTPGRCVQCKTNSDCATKFGTAAPVCDANGKCVQCIAANDASGADCGYLASASTPRDPHNERTCSANTNTCVDGCATDAQCGCPAQNGSESLCPRYAVAEHCDTARTTAADDPGVTTLGACVECTTDAHCSFRVKGSTRYGNPGTYATQNGSRCVA
jgi:hypothetical protein